MKSALEMLITTQDARYIAKEKESEKEQKISKEVAIRTRILVENILAEFERDFRNWGGEPNHFIKRYVLSDISTYYPGNNYKVEWTNHKYYYFLKEEDRNYANGSKSYTADLDKPVDLTLMVDILSELGYKVFEKSTTVETLYKEDRKNHRGWGAIAFPAFSLSIPIN